MRVTTVVITGGPATGKTATVQFLSRRYLVYREAARLVLTRNPAFKGKTALAARGVPFQRAIWRLQVRHFRRAQRQSRRWAFFDRGIPDSFAYLKLSHDQPPRELCDVAARVRYDAVFILDPLPFYETDLLRDETRGEARRVHAQICKSYTDQGYRPIRVPFDTIEKRVGFIVRALRQAPSSRERQGETQPEV